MNKRILILFMYLSIFIVDKTEAQTTKLDSLEQVLKLHDTEDTVKVNLLNEIAYVVYKSDFEKTRNYATLAGELADSLNFPKGKAQSLRLIGISFTNSDKAKALTYFQSALKINEDIDDKIGIIKCLRTLGLTYRELRKDSISNVYFQKGLSISETFGYKKEVADFLHVLSNGYLLQGKYDLAIEGYKKAIIIFEEEGEQKQLLDCTNSLGILYSSQGNYPMALECFQKGLKIGENLNNKNSVFGSLLNIGSLYSSKGNIEKSLEYSQRALKIAEELHYKSQITACLNNIGILYLKTNNPQALEYFQKALANAEELQTPILIIGSLEKIGNVYENQGDFEKAMDYYLRAMKLSEEEEGMKNFAYLTLYYAGRNCLKQKKYTEALSYSLKSLEIANKLNLLGNQKNLHELLSEIYNATHDYKKAYINHKLFKELNDSIYNESNIKKITELEYTYKYEKEKQATELEQHKKDAVQAAEKKQQGIIILALILGFVFMILLVVYIYRSYKIKKKSNIILTKQKEEIEAKNEELVQLNEEISSQKEEITTINNVIETKNEKLQELNATKDKFFNIIAHDLKNPFNVILGFSDLLRTGSNQYNQEQTMEIISMMHTSAENAYKLLENLLEWSRSQTGEIDFKPKNLVFKDLVVESENLCENFAKEKSISISNEIPDNLIVYADPNMLSTILRNLITNAIKFTHKGGNITITSILQNAEITILVSDTGIGMNENTRSKLFKINEKISILGTEKEKGTGLGLILCKEFVEKHGGEIWVESELGKGSNFKFSIPIH